MNEVVATYEEAEDLSCVYVYVTPKAKFPGPDHLFTESRVSEIVLDYERGTGRLLGIEIVTQTAPDQIRPAP